ncbi:BfmA/BtgA family mobilization protein [Aureibaculum conchae]|uniref:BfmA/BtgA family mobilization protein n=1 Tax=Aureibaculum sp. 2308TA14-22 TaxID=3108392 RepID=UPI003394E754
MDDFKAVRLKRKTLSRFKRFSKKVSKSYSETLETVINFFEWHGFMPADRFERSMVEEIVKNRKRTDAIIAIIKSIEKEQTKPTTAMLMSLFEENLSQTKEEPILIEKKFADNPMDKQLQNTRIEEATVPKIRYERLTEKMNLVKQDFSNVLDKVKIVKSNFGKNYLKLEVTEAELIKLKRTLKNL